jgi:hypothetical protein
MEIPAFPSCRGYRFAPQIIAHCVWLYYRFCLSFRDIQEMMLERRRSLLRSHPPLDAQVRYRVRTPNSATQRARRGYLVSGRGFLQDQWPTGLSVACRRPRRRSTRHPRAVADALPFLTRATQVTVLAINPQKGGTEHGDVPGADIAWYLARHGVKAEATQTYSGEVDAGNLLLSRGRLLGRSPGHGRVRAFAGQGDGARRGDPNHPARHDATCADGALRRSAFSRQNRSLKGTPE